MVVIVLCYAPASISRRWRSYSGSFFASSEPLHFREVTGVLGVGGRITRSFRDLRREQKTEQVVRMRLQNRICLRLRHRKRTCHFGYPADVEALVGIERMPLLLLDHPVRLYRHRGKELDAVVLPLLT